MPVVPTIGATYLFSCIYGPGEMRVDAVDASDAVHGQYELETILFDSHLILRLCILSVRPPPTVVCFHQGIIGGARKYCSVQNAAFARLSRSFHRCQLSVYQTGARIIGVARQVVGEVVLVILWRCIKIRDIEPDKCSSRYCSRGKETVAQKIVGKFDTKHGHTYQ